MSDLKLNIGDAVRNAFTDEVGVVRGFEGILYLVEFSDDVKAMGDNDISMACLFPYFVTYGCGGNLRNCYSKVFAESYGAARKQISDTIGGRFAFCYTDKEFKGQPEKYGLIEVPLQGQTLDPADC